LDSGFDFGGVSEELERVKVRKKQRLESRLEEVESILEGRTEIHEHRVSELNEEIRKQRNRLESAQSSEEGVVRSVLKELYRERRREYLEEWRDRESWLERKLELEDELDSVRGVDDLDF